MLIFDDDDIDVPQSADYEPPDPGVTDPTLLVSTGMRIGYYGTAAPTGWVRCNGRSLGSPSSGATERANADAQARWRKPWAQTAAGVTQRRMTCRLPCPSFSTGRTFDPAHSQTKPADHEVL